MIPFVHLHVHTQYSLLDGAIRLKDLFETARGYNMTSVAITDHGNMFGALEFYDLAHKKYGIKPIIGCEAYMAARSRHDRGSKMMDAENAGDEDRNYHLVLLARNLDGYQNLMRLVSLGYTEGFYYKPRMDKEILRKYNEGLICLSGCLKGEISSLLLRKDIDGARRTALEYAEIFGPENFYLEIQANGIPDQAIVNDGLVSLARELSLPLVATNDCHYLRKSDARAHEILLCIQTGKTIADEKRFKFQTDQLYFKSPDEMEKDFAYVPDALRNTLEIAEKCNLKLDLGSYHFPVFTLEADESIDQRFEREAREGFELRIEAIRRKRPSFSDQDLREYKERLEYELDVIKKMEFPAYFLIVADFINFAKNNGVPVGPGAGPRREVSLPSSCGSRTSIPSSTG